MSLVLVSPSTLSWFHVRAATGRRREWRTAGSTLAREDDGQHRRHPGMDHPDTLGDAGDADRPSGRPVDLGKHQRHGRGLCSRVGRPEGDGRGLEPFVGGRQPRRQARDPVRDDRQRKPGSDEPGREHERPIDLDTERRRSIRAMATWSASPAAPVAAFAILWSKRSRSPSRHSRRDGPSRGGPERRRRHSG